MRSNYKKLGNYIRQVSVRNINNNISEVCGVSMEKYFIPSIAKTESVDLSKYKVVKKGQFALILMKVGRDNKVSVAYLDDKEAVIISPAYHVFEVIDENILDPRYLMMWLSRSESDRYFGYMSAGSIRGSITFEEFCSAEINIPSIEKQREIVAEYYAITNRIKLNEQLNQKLEETAQAIYKEWFVDFEFPDENGKPYKSNGGEMVYCDELEKEIPKGWGVKELRDICLVLNRGITPKYTESDDGVIVINQKCIRNNSIDFSLSRKHSVKLKKIATEKYLKKFDTLINSTGQGTLGRVGILKEVKAKMTVDTHVTIVRAVPSVDSLFLSFLLSFRANEIESLGEGSTGQTELRREVLGGMQVLIPNYETQKLFSLKVSKIINHLVILEKELPYLQTLEMTLLSKMATVEG